MEIAEDHMHIQYVCIESSEDEEETKLATYDESESKCHIDCT